MSDIRQIFWRAVTPADFFNVERSRAAAPKSGGGQSYFSISFAGLKHEELGAFLGVKPPTLIGTTRPKVKLDAVSVTGEPEVSAPIEFAPRYLPPGDDDRYRITRQNRQYQSRHPAWLPSRGFPKAEDDVRRGDPLPDLTHLKLYIVKTDAGAYAAGFVNSPAPPSGLPKLEPLDVLFATFDRTVSAGVIDLEPGELSLDTWSAAFGPTPVGPGPEIEEAIESTRVAAGKRPRGQGFQVDVKRRRATELRAMAVATETLAADGWTVVDVSATKSYDLECTRRGEELHVEVKGTMGDGASVLLTPGEVKHARNYEPVALFVVAGIRIEPDPAHPRLLIGVGGEYSLTHPWSIDQDGELVPTGYEYKRSV